MSYKNGKYDEADNETQFDTLLDLWCLECEEGHCTTEAQSEDHRDKETGKA